MSEWLTTGQMIDRLKVGEVAEGSTHWEVKRLEDGMIVELNSGTPFHVSHSFLKEAWRILPKYVSFNEAMKAIHEGNYAVFHHEEGKTTTIGLYGGMTWTRGLSWRILIEGKWTIQKVEGSTSE